MVEQARLATAIGYGAIFAAAGTDAGLLNSALRLHKVPCFSIHLDEVARGACAIAICAEPTVSIIVSRANAAAADIHFATAFRMMVREI